MIVQHRKKEREWMRECKARFEMDKIDQVSRDLDLPRISNGFVALFLSEAKILRGLELLPVSVGFILMKIPDSNR
jgi:hypothetical protein